MIRIWCIDFGSIPSQPIFSDEAISQKEQILKKAEKEIADMVVDAAAKVVGSNSADTNAALYDTFLNKAGDK